MKDSNKLLGQLQVDWKKNKMNDSRLASRGSVKSKAESKVKQKDNRIIPLNIPAVPDYTEQVSNRTDEELQAFESLRKIQNLLDSLNEEALNLRDHLERTKDKKENYEMQLVDLMHIVENMDMSQKLSVSVTEKIQEVRRRRRLVKDFEDVSNQCVDEIFQLTEEARLTSGLIDKALSTSYRAYTFRTEEISNLFENLGGYNDSLVPMFPPNQDFSMIVEDETTPDQEKESENVNYTTTVSRSNSTWLVSESNKEESYETTKLKHVVDYLIDIPYKHLEIDDINKKHIINHLNQRIDTNLEEDESIRDKMIDLLSELKS